MTYDTNAHDLSSQYGPIPLCLWTGSPAHQTRTHSAWSRSSVTLSTTKNKVSNPLEALKTTYQDELNQIDAIMLAHMDKKHPLAIKIAHHLLKGGKRFRALLLIHIAHLLGAQGAQARLLASIVELIHAATLLHDDVIDASAMRRLKKTAHKLWGNKASILVGDYIYAIAFKKIAELNDPKLVHALADATLFIVQGELKQWQQQKQDINEAAYYDTIDAKTATLFVLTTHLPAMITQQPQTTQEALKKLGHHLGMAYQLRDDDLDYAGDPKQLGKSIGDDFLEGKATLPYIYTLSQATKSEAAFLKQAREQKQPKDFPKVLDLMNQYNAHAYVADKIAYHVEAAQRAIEPLKVCSEDQDLQALFVFLTTRNS